MSSLRIHVDSGAGERLLPFELIEMESLRRETGTVTDGATADIAVSPGSYVVQTVTPEGVVLSTQVDVSENSDATAVLGSGPLPAPPPPAASGGSIGERLEQALSQLLPFQIAAEGGSAGATTTESLEGAGPVVGSAAGPPASSERSAESTTSGSGRLWGCLWAFDPGAAGWHPVSWPVGAGIPQSSPTEALAVTLPLPGYGLHALVIGGSDVGTTVLMLPPGGGVTVRIDARTEEPAVSARTANLAAESLLDYLNSGQLVAASEIAGSVVDEAEQLLHDKVADPLGAVVGGLFLLRTRNLDRLHDWPANLAALFPWLPDAPVVRAAQLLTAAEVPRDELRTLLLGAVRAGVPVYSDSLNRLHHALLLLSAERPDDDELQVALAAVRPYAQACDWGLALTTFPGSSPASPTFQEVHDSQGLPGWAEPLSRASS